VLAPNPGSATIPALQVAVSSVPLSNRAEINARLG
jgi:hypothetical protein